MNEIEIKELYLLILFEQYIDRYTDIQKEFFRVQFYMGFIRIEQLLNSISK